VKKSFKENVDGQRTTDSGRRTLRHPKSSAGLRPDELIIVTDL